MLKQKPITFDTYRLCTWSRHHSSAFETQPLRSWSRIQSHSIPIDYEAAAGTTQPWPSSQQHTMTQLNCFVCFLASLEQVIHSLVEKIRKRCDNDECNYITLPCFARFCVVFALLGTSIRSLVPHYHTLITRSSTKESTFSYAPNDTQNVA